MSNAPTEARAREPSKPDESDTYQSETLLSKSARGATFLVGLQVGSRALTFVVNQILLRYLSPELLAISTQLELYSITSLYFARESLRVALQRQRKGVEARKPERHGPKEETTTTSEAEAYASARRAQEAVNLSYLAMLLGAPLTLILAKVYKRRAEAAVLDTPYFQASVEVYVAATLLELLIEPCHVVAQQQMLYGTRALAETSATFTRCIVTCAIAVWSSRDLGVLPFAAGQLSYACMLNIIYYSKLWPIATQSGYSLMIRSLDQSSNPNVFSLFPKRLLNLAVTLYAQSGLKHLLTQGDSILIATLASLNSQGTYALASNYGSLLARVLFQPIEESSRGVFGGLLAQDSTLRPKNVQSAKRYLSILLRSYNLLSVFIISVGPTLAPICLRYVAGPRWSSTSAGEVLAVYCYYVPLLAINGILEAFVSAAATPAELRKQSMWMFAFSAGFVGAGFVSLRVYDLGAKGLVFANAVNMGMRILWSWRFVKTYFQREGVDLTIREFLPTWGTTSSGFGTAWYLNVMKKSFDGTWRDLLQCLVIGGVYGILLLCFELFEQRDLLYQYLQKFRPFQATLENSTREKKTK